MPDDIKFNRPYTIQYNKTFGLRSFQAEPDQGAEQYIILKSITFKIRGHIIMYKTHFHTILKTLAETISFKLSCE